MPAEARDHETLWSAFHSPYRFLTNTLLHLNIIIKFPQPSRLPFLGKFFCTEILCLCLVYLSDFIILTKLPNEITRLVLTLASIPTEIPLLVLTLASIPTEITRFVLTLTAITTEIPLLVLTLTAIPTEITRLLLTLTAIPTDMARLDWWIKTSPYGILHYSTLTVSQHNITNT